MILGRGAARAEKRFKAETQLLITKLRESIVSGKLAPGEPVGESRLDETSKVDAVALRQALRELEAEGYVTFRPNHEVIVSRPTPEEIEDHFTIAGALEALAARLAVARARAEEIERLRQLHQVLKEACQNRDMMGYFDARNEFHRLIAEIARNERLYRLIDQVRHELQKTRPLSLRVPQRLDYSIREHDQIMDAFLKKNPELASSAMMRHLNNQMESLIHAGEVKKGESHER